MEGVTILETAALNELIKKIDDLSKIVHSNLAELKEAKKTYLSIAETMDLTGMSRSTLDRQREQIGFTNSGGCIRFKRSDVMEYMERNYYKAKNK